MSNIKLTKKNSLQHFKNNLSELLKLKNSTDIIMVKDSRYKRTKKNAKMSTAKYQIAIKINNEKEYKKIQKCIRNFLIEYYHDCSPMPRKINGILCKNNKYTDMFRPARKKQKSHGKFYIFYPDKFEGSKKYIINHGIAERLVETRPITRKPDILNIINKLGSQEK